MQDKTKIVLKRIGTTFLWMVVLAGFAVLLVAAVQDKDATKCSGIVVKITGSDDNYFIEDKDIKALVARDRSVNPVGKPIGEINIATLERIVERDPWVKDAEIFFDNQQKLNIKVVQREPVARVFTFSGNSFYLDETADHIPVSSRYAARVPVFTGFPTDGGKLQKPDSLLASQIIDMGKYIMASDFWMAQVEQVVITGDRKFEFIPKLGDHVISFGDGADVEKKFTKLLAFYKEGLNKVGWNNYTRINIAYENEVVCTRKDGKAPIQPELKQTDSLKLADADEPPLMDAVEPEKKEEKKPEPPPVKHAEKPAPAKAKAKKEPVIPQRQPKAVYKPEKKSVNTTKNNKTP
jgi:cell division protein FtsQ